MRVLSKTWQDYIAGNFEGAEYNGDPYGALFAKKEKQAFATSFYNDYVCDVTIKKYEKFDGTNYDNFHIKKACQSIPLHGIINAIQCCL